MTRRPVDTRLKQRMIGAIVLTALAIIVIPMLLDGSAQDRAKVIARIPEPPAIPLRKLTVTDIDRKMKQMQASSAATLPHLAETRTAPAAPDNATTPADSPAAGGNAAGLNLDQNNLPVSWSLQLASFKNRDNATKLRASLRAAEYRAYIIAASTDDGDVYRVFVGPMLEKAKLAELGKKIESRFNLKGQIVRYRIEDDAGQLGG